MNGRMKYRTRKISNEARSDSFGCRSPTSGGVEYAEIPAHG